MAIAFRASQAWATSVATTAAATIPSGTTTGDMMLLMVGIKPYSGTYSINNGWTLLGEFADGTVANGSGVGSVDIAVFYKEHTGSETNPTITFGRTAAPAGYSIISFSKAAGETWDTPVHVFQTITASTSISRTLGSNPGLTEGDAGIVTFHTRDDSALTVPTWTATGATLGTVSIQPATALASSTSNDVAATRSYRLVTSGTASAAPVCTATQAVAETGALSFVRLRVSSSVSTNVDVENAAAASATADTGLSIATDATNASASAAAQAAVAEVAPGPSAAAAALSALGVSSVYVSTYSVWYGGVEKPATLTVWDGSAELPVDLGTGVL